MEKIEIYKDYLVQIQRKALNRPYIILGDDVAPTLRKYVYMLENIKFEEGDYEEYYGRVKRLVNVFIEFRTKTMDQCIKEVDHYTNIVEKKSLVDLINKTIDMHKNNEKEFVTAFDEIEVAFKETPIFDGLMEMYEKFIESLYLLKDKIEKFDKMDVMMKFSNEHFPMSLEMKNELFCFTHEFVAVALAKSLYKIRVSLEEIYLRMDHNLRKVEKETEEKLFSLKRKLYEKHKEKLIVNRRMRRCSSDIAKIEKEIQTVSEKVDNFEDHPYLESLRTEVDYWRQRLEYFRDIEGTLNKIKAEDEDIDVQINDYENINSTVLLPGPRNECWQQIKKSFEKRKKYLKQQKLNASFALFTFFGVKGANRMLYSDVGGQCCLDTFNHKMYVFDHGLKKYHMNENGTFVEISENKYYYDENGRYILKHNNKFYQVGPCTSKYQLRDDSLFDKVCEDGENIMSFKDYEHYEILPETENIDFTRTLDKESVKYLWDSFGSILPEALRDVGLAIPNNPIPHLAHRILYHKYCKSFKELEKKQKEAVSYRDDKLKQRKDRDDAAAKAWKAKQVQRRKPEESDDTQNIVICQQQQERAFIESLKFYDV